MSNAPSISSHPLKHDDVVALVGALEDSVIASILATRATYDDIEQALLLLGCDHGAAAKHLLTPAAEAVHDILAEEPSFATPDRSDR